MMTDAEKSAEQARWLAEEECIELRAQNKALLEALQELVCCPAFNGQVFERDKESHRAWTLARLAIAQATEPDVANGTNLAQALLTSPK